MGIMGLWAFSLRSSVFRFAGEMIEVLGYGVLRMWINRRPNSLSPFSYLSYSSNFLVGHFVSNWPDISPLEQQLLYVLKKEFLEGGRKRKKDGHYSFVCCPKISISIPTKSFFLTFFSFKFILLEIFVSHIMRSCSLSFCTLYLDFAFVREGRAFNLGLTFILKVLQFNVPSLKFKS